MTNLSFILVVVCGFFANSLFAQDLYQPYVPSTGYSSAPAWQPTSTDVQQIDTQACTGSIDGANYAARYELGAPADLLNSGTLFSTLLTQGIIPKLTSMQNQQTGAWELQPLYQSDAINTTAYQGVQRALLNNTAPPAIPAQPAGQASGNDDLSGLEAALGAIR